MSDTPDLELLNSFFHQLVPHNRALGLRLVKVDEQPPTATAMLPWHQQLVGDPSTGVLHGGAITTLMDTTCGAAVYLWLKQDIPIATLDLRIDYLKPATPRQAVHARAECLKATHNIAFVRAIAYHEDPADPIASAAATFIISRRPRT